MPFSISFLPATLLTQGIRRIGAPQSALVSAISPVITLALGAWLLDEFLTAWQKAALTVTDYGDSYEIRR